MMCHDVPRLGLPAPSPGWSGGSRGRRCRARSPAVRAAHAPPAANIQLESTNQDRNGCQRNSLWSASTTAVRKMAAKRMR
eukprot:899777-Pyramimonas_sp.AAC.1